MESLTLLAITNTPCKLQYKKLGMAHSENISAIMQYSWQHVMGEFLWWPKTYVTYTSLHTYTDKAHLSMPILHDWDQTFQTIPSSVGVLSIALCTSCSLCCYHVSTKEHIVKAIRNCCDFFWWMWIHNGFSRGESGHVLMKMVKDRNHIFVLILTLW